MKAEANTESMCEVDKYTSRRRRRDNEKPAVFVRLRTDDIWGIKYIPCMDGQRLARTEGCFSWGSERPRLVRSIPTTNRHVIVAARMVLRDIGIEFLKAHPLAIFC